MESYSLDNTGRYGKHRVGVRVCVRGSMDERVVDVAYDAHTLQLCEVRVRVRVWMWRNETETQANTKGYVYTITDIS